MDDGSPQSLEYVSAYDQAASDHDWLSELSEEWISNSSEGTPSEQGSGRGMSVRAAFGTGSSKFETIPEENETSTVRIVLGETDVHNTPEWKRRLEENKVRDLFSPCHLENLFKEDTTRTSKSASQPVSPDLKQSTMKESPLTNTAAFLKDITDNISVISPKKPQQSPLRQVFTSGDTSSPVTQETRSTTVNSMSSGKSTMRSSDEKSTHESSDDDSLDDSNEDLSIAEPTQTLMDPLSFYTARPDQDEITVHTPPEYQNESADDSYRTAKAMQTPHPNATSLSDSLEAKSRSVRFATPAAADEMSYSFNFTPQQPLETVDVERPQTPQQSAKTTPHTSPFKLFSRYDTFTNNKLEDMVNNLLPKPDDDDDFASSRDRKRARREALSRDRVPRLPQNQEIRHNRMPSLTTQEMFDDAEDFMRDLRSMPRRITDPEDEIHESQDVPEDNTPEDDIVEQDIIDEDFGASEIDEGNVSSDFEDHSPHDFQNHPQYVDYSDTSEAYDSIRHVASPEKLGAFPVSSENLHLPQRSPSNPNSRVSSAESMQVITPHDVSHLLQSTVGSMTFDRERNAWFKIRPSQQQPRNEEESFPLDEAEEEDIPEEEEEEEEEDIFRDIDDLVVSDEGEDSNLGSRPSSSGSMQGGGISRVPLLKEENTYEQEQEDESEVDEEEAHQETRMSPGEKERGSSQEYPEDQELPPPVREAPRSSIPLPPKSPLRKSMSPSPQTSPRKSQRNHQPSPLRKPLKESVQNTNIPFPPQRPSAPSPMRSPHRKAPSADRMRKSLPLPPLETPEAVKSQPDRSAQSHRRSQYEHLMATPQTKRPAKTESPFLEPRGSLRLSISPPPADLSFAQTPRQDISFSVTTRVLVKHLTDFEPFEPYWENLRHIDFRDKGVTSLDGLKSFCPKVEEIDIKDCKVKYLTGLPASMRVLKANGNRLGGLVSFAWGKNLQYLDLANNEIDSLAGLSSLIHLRELRVDNNLLTSLDGILQLDGLLKVSAKHNQISCLDFVGSRLTRLEVLECQKNCIGWVEGLEELIHLMSLHLDDNNLAILQPKQPLRSLRTLKLCRNELDAFDPKFYPELRTLYLDENQIHSLSGVRKLRLLENFSARSQRGKPNIGIHGLSELRKVYLSGNTIPLRLDRQFFNLQYLELAAIKLTSLPQNFASFVPNVRILNLSFNSLKDVTPIRDMRLLKRLFLIGNRLSSLSDGTTETLLSLTELQVLDLRLNPITLSFYPPVEAKKSDHHKDMFSLVTGRQAQSTWQQRDKIFRNDMPRSWELRRKAYQGLVYTACPKLKWFDGSEVSRGSVAEGERVLKSLEGVVNSVRSAKKEQKR